MKLYYLKKIPLLFTIKKSRGMRYYLSMQLKFT